MFLSAEFLEAVNGCLLIIYLGVILFFIRYIVRCLVNEPCPFWKWYDQVSGAIAITTMVIGDFLIRGPVWLLRHLHNSEQASIAGALEPAMTWTVLIGAILAIVGGVCIVREFASERFKFAAPLILAIASLVFGIGMAWP